MAWSPKLCVTYRVVCFSRLTNRTHHIKSRTKTTQFFSQLMMVSDVELCWLFRFAKEVASGNPNPNEAKLLCCTRLRYLFIKICKKKVSVCVQQQFSDALSRWTIFGVRNCFATHIHVRFRIAIGKYAFGCSMLVQPVNSNKVFYFLLLCWRRQTDSLFGIAVEKTRGVERTKQKWILAFALFHSIPLSTLDIFTYSLYMFSFEQNKIWLSIILSTPSHTTCASLSAYVELRFVDTKFSHFLFAKSNKIFNWDALHRIPLSVYAVRLRRRVFSRTNSLTVLSTWKIGDLFAAIIVHVLLAQLLTQLVYDRLRVNAAMRREEKRKINFGVIRMNVEYFFF